MWEGRGKWGKGWRRRRCPLLLSRRRREKSEKKLLLPSCVSSLSFFFPTTYLFSLSLSLSLVSFSPAPPNKKRAMTTSPKKSSPQAAAADAQTDLASARLIPLLCDSVKATGEADAARLSLEFPSVAGDRDKVDERGERVYEEALFRGGFDRGDRLPLEVASSLGSPAYSISGGVGGGRGSPGGAAASSVFAIACVDPDAPGGVRGSSANAPWLHQLIVDAPGPDPSRGRELCPWMPPSPPKGLHR